MYGFIYVRVSGYANVIMCVDLCEWVCWIFWGHAALCVCMSAHLCLLECVLEISTSLLPVSFEHVCEGTQEMQRRETCPNHLMERELKHMI